MTEEQEWYEHPVTKMFMRTLNEKADTIIRSIPDIVDNHLLVNRAVGEYKAYHSIIDTIKEVCNASK